MGLIPEKFNLHDSELITVIRIHISSLINKIEMLNKDVIFNFHFKSSNNTLIFHKWQFTYHISIQIISILSFPSYLIWSMTYFRTYTEFLSSSLSADDISDTPDKWRGLIVDFIGPGVDVTKLLEIFPEIS